MEYDDDAQVLNFLSGMMVGVAIGAGLALLTAPQSGRRTRRRIRRTAGTVRDTATDRWDTLADEVRDRVDEVLEVAKNRVGA